MCFVSILFAHVIFINPCLNEIQDHFHPILYINCCLSGPCHIFSPLLFFIPISAVTPLSLPWKSLPFLQCRPQTDIKVIYWKSTHVPASGIIKMRRVHFCLFKEFTVQLRIQK